VTLGSKRVSGALVCGGCNLQRELVTRCAGVNGRQTELEIKTTKSQIVEVITHLRLLLFLVIICVTTVFHLSVDLTVVLILVGYDVRFVLGEVQTVMFKMCYANENSPHLVEMKLHALHINLQTELRSKFDFGSR
jgi:hypothetical protein